MCMYIAVLVHHACVSQNIDGGAIEADGGASASVQLRHWSQSSAVQLLLPFLPWPSPRDLPQIVVAEFL